MKLTVPDPGDQNFAQPISSALEGPVDAHDHQAIGKPLSIGASTVDQDLSFNGYNATMVRSVQLQNNLVPLNGTYDVCNVYTAEGDVWCNDAAGNQIRLTENGVLNVGSAVLNNLYMLSVSNINRTILYTDKYNLINVFTNTTPVTITLPLANSVTPGRFYFITDASNTFNTHACTLSVTGGLDRINTGGGISFGVTSQLLNQQGMQVLLYSDGVSRWYCSFPQSIYSNTALGISQGSEVIVDNTSTIRNDGYYIGTSTLTGTINVTGTINAANTYAILSNVNSGIQSTISGGIATNTSGTIRSNNAAGGFVLNGGANDWVTFNGSRSKTIVFPLMPLTTTGVITGSSAGWVSVNGIQFKVLNNTGGNVGLSTPQYFAIPVMHHGATINTVTVYWVPTGNDVSLPANQPTINVLRYTLAANAVPSGTSLNGGGAQGFGAPNITAYNNGGLSNALTFTCNQNNTIDSTQYIYVVQIVDENGANSHDQNTYYGMQVTYSGINNMRFAT
jgi:hypothetical protein